MVSLLDRLMKIDGKVLSNMKFMARYCHDNFSFILSILIKEYIAREATCLRISQNKSFNRSLKNE